MRVLCLSFSFSADDYFFRTCCCHVLQCSLLFCSIVQLVIIIFYRSNGSGSGQTSQSRVDMCFKQVRRVNPEIAHHSIFLTRTLVGVEIDNSSSGPSCSLELHCVDSDTSSYITTSVSYWVLKNKR